MQKIIYVPPGGSLDDTSARAEFSLTPPYIIGTVSGTGGAETTILSSAVPGLPGAYLQGVRAESRVISFFINVSGSGRKDMYENRFALVKLLTPRETPGTLYYTNDYKTLRIAAIPQTTPGFSERLENYNRAELSFWCPSPYFEELTEKTGQMAFLNEGFTFPFSFGVKGAAGYGVSFASVQKEVVLHNAGSVPTPIEVSIKGPANQPAIVNLTTGERVGLSHTLLEGETLQINTKKGEKKVLIQKTSGEEDAFHYIDPQSVFFELQPGDNLLKYESADETEPTQILVRYRELYAGV